MNQLIEIQYFGCVNYWIDISNFSKSILSLYEMYPKMTFRNRAVIVGANGLIDLSIPIHGGRNCKQLVKDVKIDSTQDWRTRHWRSIISAYGKAPFFEFYRSDIEKLISNKNIYLFDFNYEIFEWIVKVLKCSAEFERELSKSDKMANIEISTDLWKPSNFQEKTYRYQYFQVFETKLNFQYNVSILDLIFCEGPNTKNVLLNAVL